MTVQKLNDKAAEDARFVLAIVDMRAREGKTFGEITKQLRGAKTRNRIMGIFNRHCDNIERDNRDRQICEGIDAGQTSEDLAAGFEVTRRYVDALRDALAAIDSEKGSEDNGD